jgi:hypothetical protein
VKAGNAGGTALEEIPPGNHKEVLHGAKYGAKDDEVKWRRRGTLNISRD